MSEAFPMLVGDKVPDLIRAEGRTPVTDYVDDRRIIPMLGAKVLEETEKLLSASKEETLAQAAAVYRALRAFCSEIGVTDDMLRTMPSQDGHAPMQLREHAREVAEAGPNKRLQAAANMRLALLGFCNDARILAPELEAEVDKRTEERGDFSKGIVLVGIKA